MRRRKFLKNGLVIGGAGLISGAAAWHHFFDGRLFNPCELVDLPESLARNDFMLEAFDGINFNEVWDCHFHLVGNGLKPAFEGQTASPWLNPKMMSFTHPKQRLQYSFYLDASCVANSEYADKEFINTLQKTLATVPQGVRFMLLAFDFQHDSQGNQVRQHSTFYIPNEFVAQVAAFNSQFEWIASIHPYREDAIEQLEWCKANGARAVKWLPPAMNIDPSSEKCDSFYEKLVELDLPLLTHAGKEQAVHSDELQALSNPLLLRRPLELGVKVIVAHCASLGAGIDLESNAKHQVSNLQLFARLMDDVSYQNNLLADISAINLFNRDIDEVKLIVSKQEWHDRLLFATDFPLTGVQPIISVTNLSSHGLLDSRYIEFLTEVRRYNSWLFDFLLKRFMRVGEIGFSRSVFHTKKHFIKAV